MNNGTVWNPRSYQRRAVEFLVSRGAAGLFLDPGLGKTAITLQTIKALREAGQIRAALIVAPLRVCHNVWPNEIEKWAQFQDITYTILHGDLRKRTALLRPGSDVYLINFEGLPWLLKQPKILERLRIDTLVIDESSKMKSGQTQRFKAVKPFLGKFRRRYILTGTPAPNGYLDLYSQIYILDRGGALGAYYSHYRGTYFYALDQNGWNWNMLPGSEERIQRAIAPYILRMDEKELNDLPKLIGEAGSDTENRILVDLPEDARAAYDAMEEEMMLELESGHNVIAASAGVVTQKCCQLANGGLYYDTPSEIGMVRNTTVVHTAKTEALQDLIEELSGQPLIVAYEFRHDLERIAKALWPKLKPETVPYIGGGNTQNRSKQLIEQWNDRRLPVLLVHPAAAGHGLNLQAGGSHICWYGIPWNLEHYVQTIRRLYRQGATAPSVFVYHIVARSTVDMLKMRTLKRKDKTQKGFLDALREYRKNRG
jgi:SNF2 family DNA or RNA helicase